MIDFHVRNFAQNVNYDTKFGGIAKQGGTGNSAPIDTPNKLALQLSIDRLRIVNFKIVGDDVFCKIKGTFALSMKNVENLTYVVSSKITATRFNCFEKTKCSFIDTPNLVSISRETFRFTSELENIDIPSVLTMDSWQTFDNSGLASLGKTSKLKSVKLNNMHTMTDGKSRQWNANNVLEVFECKKLKNLTNQILITPEGPYFFRGFRNGAKIRTNIHLRTSFNGGANPHLLKAKTEQGVIVEFYDDDGNYVSTL